MAGIRYSTGILLLSLLISSCRDFKPQAQRITVAKAGEKVLFYDQIPNLIQPGLAYADSVAIIQNYVNRWAKREILKLKAIENLTPEFRSEVERQLDEIRTNLLIHRYQQQMISQKLDTLISEEEIEKHYNENSQTFILNNNIVKALFIKVPSNVPNIEKVPSLLRSSDPTSLAQLELFCYQFADKFDDFDEQWIHLNTLLVELPATVEDQEDFLRRNRYFETQDSLFNYYVAIRDYKLRATVAPYDYARNNILAIILNARKMDFLQELENGVFNEAIRADLFKLY
jgi:hypothetical protein